MVSDNPKGSTTIEDLVPFEIALCAAALYCEEFVPDIAPLELSLNAEGVLSGGMNLLNSLEKAIRTATSEPTFHLDKIAFARCVVEVVRRDTVSAEAVKQLADNFRLLNQEIGKRQRRADSDERHINIESRIKRAKEKFLADNPNRARREQVIVLIEDIERQLDNSHHADLVIATMRRWRYDFKLEEDPRSPVDDYDNLKEALSNLAYLPTNEAESQSSP